MQFELSTGYKIWITKIGKKKKWDFLISTRPNSNDFIKIGLIDSPKLLYTVFTGKEYAECEVNE